MYTPAIQWYNRRTLCFETIQRANSMVTRVRLHSFHNSTNAGFVSPMYDCSVAHGAIPFLWDQNWSTSAQLHVWVTILIPWHTLCLNVWSLANQQISMSFGYLLYTYKYVTQNMAYITSIAEMDTVSCTESVLWSVTYSRKCLWKKYSQILQIDSDLQNFFPQTFSISQATIAVNRCTMSVKQ